MKMFNRNHEMKKLYFHIFFLILGFQVLVAQEEMLIDSSFLILPPLAEVLIAALHHSPIIEAKSLETQKIKQELKIEKKKWMDYIFVEGAANYGIFDQVVISGLTYNGASNTGFITKSEQIRYYGGIGVKLPISAINSRRNEIEIKKLSEKQLEFEKLQLQKNIKQLIIEEYYKLKYFEESMKIFQSTYQTLEISYMKAERELLNGRIDLSDFALLASSMGKLKDDYYKAKNNFFAQYHKLQDMTGIIFETR